MCKRLFILLFCCISCSQFNEQESNDSSQVIPIDEAIMKMNLKTSQLYGGTKSSSEYTIDVITASDLQCRTRSTSGVLDLPDTLLYVVNFHDNSGFALLSASRKLKEDTFCITEQGNMSAEALLDAFNDMSDNSSIINTTEEFTDGKVFVPSLLMSAVVLEALGVTENREEEEDYSVSTKADVKYGPYLKTKWGQSNIYDKKVFNRYTPNHALCGCVVTAVAQIMVYNKYPDFTVRVFDGKMCNWQDLEGVNNYAYWNRAYHSRDTAAFDQVAHFVRELGKHNNVKVRYGKNENKESSAYAEGAQRTFQNYGYSDVDKHLGFGNKKQKIADKVIRGGRPVYLDGCGKKCGHAWVLDGLRGNYYHINWGWYGQWDGYYSKGVFRTSQRSDMDDVDVDKSENDYHHYYKGFRMVTYGAFISTPIQ